MTVRHKAQKLSITRTTPKWRGTKPEKVWHHAQKLSITRTTPKWRGTKPEEVWHHAQAILRGANPS